MKSLLLHENMVLRYVVPFYFGSERKQQSAQDDLAENQSYEELYRAFEDNPKWTREERGTKERDTYEYIQNMLFGEDEDKVIGRGWLCDLSGQEFRRNCLQTRCST